MARKAGIGTESDHSLILANILCPWLGLSQIGVSQRQSLLWGEVGSGTAEPDSVLPAAQSLAMPFGCVTLGDKKNYNQPSEVTDRYDLGQVIKT